MHHNIIRARTKNYQLFTTYLDGVIIVSIVRQILYAREPTNIDNSLLDDAPRIASIVRQKYAPQNYARAKQNIDRSLLDGAILVNFVPKIMHTKNIANWLTWILYKKNNN